MLIYLREFGVRSFNLAFTLFLDGKINSSSHFQTNLKLDLSCDVIQYINAGFPCGFVNETIKTIKKSIFKI